MGLEWAKLGSWAWPVAHCDLPFLPFLPAPTPSLSPTRAQGNVAELGLLLRALTGVAPKLGGPAGARAIPKATATGAGAEAPGRPLIPGTMHCRGTEGAAAHCGHRPRCPGPPLPWQSAASAPRCPGRPLPQPKVPPTWAHGRVVAQPLLAQGSAALRAVGGGHAEARAGLPALAAGAGAHAPRGPLLGCWVTCRPHYSVTGLPPMGLQSDRGQTPQQEGCPAGEQAAGLGQSPRAFKPG